MGFIGGKMALHHGPHEGVPGLRANIAELAAMREKVGDDFWLMWDCWMSLDLDYALRLAIAAHEYGLKWLEEALIPDDYWGYRDLRQERAARDAGLDRRARVDPVRVPDAAGDGLRRHPAARRRLVRRDHRTDQDLGPGRRVRCAGRPARLERVLLPLRHHPDQQPVRRVLDDGARGRRGGADVPAAAARRAGAGQRSDETAGHARFRRRTEPRRPADPPRQPVEPRSSPCTSCVSVRPVRRSRSSASTTPLRGRLRCGQRLQRGVLRRRRDRGPEQRRQRAGGGGAVDRIRR